MTRKDYILIAEVLRVQYRRAVLSNMEGTEPQYTAREAVYSVAEELADSLRRDNPRFNPEHFLAVVVGQKELTSRP